MADSWRWVLPAGASAENSANPPNRILFRPGRGLHQGIYDNLYVGAPVLDNGTTRAAIVSCDKIGFPEPVWNALAERMEKEAGIRRENLLLAGVHTHGVPTPGLPADGPYLARLYDNIVAAARQASANLKPARGLRRGSRSRRHEP